MMNPTKRQKLQHFLNAMEVAFGRNDKNEYTQAFDDFCQLAEELEDQLKRRKA